MYIKQTRKQLREELQSSWNYIAYNNWMRSQSEILIGGEIITVPVAIKHQKNQQQITPTEYAEYLLEKTK